MRSPLHAGLRTTKPARTNDDTSQIWLPYRLRLEGLAHFREELLDLEGLEEDGLQAFLAGADDRVVGVVAEAGHQDDRDGCRASPSGGEDVVAGLVGHLDVAQDQVEVLRFHELDRLRPVRRDRHPRTV